MFRGPLTSMMGSRRIGLIGTAKPNKEDLMIVKELLESRKIKPAIEKRYPLGEVPEAIRYLEEGHAKGKLVIVIA